MPSTVATNAHKKLLLLALLALAIVVASTSGQQNQKKARSLFSIYVSNKKTHCRSEVKAARQAWRQCLQACIDNRRAAASATATTTDERPARFRSCHLRCLHRFVLVTPRRGDAYDQLVAAAGCDGTASSSSSRDWASCRTDKLQQLVASGEADVADQLSQVQRYNLLVCQHHCGAGDNADDCKALCLLRQVMEPEAFAKLSSCLAEADCDSKSTRKDRCKQRCYRKC